MAATAAVAGSTAGQLTGIAAGVGQGVAQAIGPTSSPTGDLAKQVPVGLARGLTSAAVRGGKVSFNQIATDAFGNVIGESLAARMSGVGQGQVTEPAATQSDPASEWLMAMLRGTTETFRSDRDYAPSWLETVRTRLGDPSASYDTGEGWSTRLASWRTASGEIFNTSPLSPDAVDLESARRVPSLDGGFNFPQPAGSTALGYQDKNGVVFYKIFQDGKVENFVSGAIGAQSARMGYTDAEAAADFARESAIAQRAMGVRLTDAPSSVSALSLPPILPINAEVGWDVQAAGQVASMSSDATPSLSGNAALGGWDAQQRFNYM